MKKTLLILAIAITFVSCDKKETTTNSKDFKTAYVDIIKLIDESVEAKDIEAKYKAKASEMGSKIDAEGAKLQNEYKNFKANAMANGQAWAQQKGAELQQRDQQLQYAQQAMQQQLQGASGSEMDSLFIKYKKVFKDYGKSKGYDYIFGDQKGENVLYAKDSYDITKDIIKLVNENYKSEGKKEENSDSKTEKKK